MKLVRLVLLAGAAASVALAIREPLARGVARALEPSVDELAAASRTIAPEVHAASAHVAPPMHTVATAPAPEPTPIALAPTKKVATAKTKAPGAKAFVVTKGELEAAIAAKGWGARASVVKDDDGRPRGLALHGVGRFAKFGVAEGDQLVSANGHSLRTADEAIAALGALGDARSIVVVLRRGDASYSVPITLVDDGPDPEANPQVK